MQPPPTDPLMLRPIATVRSPRTTPLDDHWRDLPAILQLAPHMDPEAFLGLDTFSHAEVIFQFHGVPDHKVCQTARHPRGREDWPRVGIFAQRGKSRPNRLGLSRCRIVRVDGRQLHVTDLDAIDGTPILDIKPWMTEFAPLGSVTQPAWSTELMQHYYRPAAEDPRTR